MGRQTRVAHCAALARTVMAAASPKPTRWALACVTAVKLPVIVSVSAVLLAMCLTSPVAGPLVTLTQQSW